MTEGDRPQGFSHETTAVQSVFEQVMPTAPLALVALLRLAEREGAYGKLSKSARRISQMRYVEGLNMPQIGDVLEISKQAVWQSLTTTPESLYKTMTKDVVMRRTNIPFREILKVYSDYRIELNAKK